MLFAVLALFGVFTQAANLGDWASVSANAWTNITFSYLLVNFQVSVWSDTQTTVSFNTYTNANLWTSLQASGYDAITLGGATGFLGSAGYELQVNTSTANIQAVITFPPGDATVFAAIGAGVNVGCLQYNSNTQALIRIGTINYIGTPSWTFSITVPSAGIYLTVAVTETFSVSATVGASAQVNAPASCNQTYQWSVKAANDLMVWFGSSSETTTITVTPQMNASYSTTGLRPLMVWFNVDLGTTTVTHSSTIKYQYTDAMLTSAGFSATEAASLRLAYYDTSSSKWTFPSGGSCDTNAKVVSLMTTHFSQWGIYHNMAGTMHIQVLLLLALMATVIGLLQ